MSAQKNAPLSHCCFPVDTTDASASCLLNMSDINECSLIHLKDVTEESIPPYNLQDVLDTEPDLNMEEVQALHRNQASGKTLSEYPVLLYLLYLIDKRERDKQEREQTFFPHVTFKVA